MKEITEQEQVKSFIYGLQEILRGYKETIDNAEGGTIATENVKSFVNEMIFYIEDRRRNIKFLN